MCTVLEFGYYINILRNERLINYIFVSSCVLVVDVYRVLGFGYCINILRNSSLINEIFVSSCVLVVPEVT